MSKLIARYFYSPICSESYNTLENLKHLFQNYDVIYFEYFNIEEDCLVSNYPWYPEEMKVINTLEGKGYKPLFFGELFLQGEKVKGFPPSPKSLKEVFDKYDLKWNTGLYPFKYKLVRREKWECKQESFTFQEYGEENLSLEVCRICTKYHPYLSENEYEEEVWEKHEKQKLLFLHSKLEDGKLVGVIAYYNMEPVGFAE